MNKVIFQSITVIIQIYHQLLHRLKMHKHQNSISPIKMLNSGSKPYQTPAKYLTQRNQTVYEQEYYKEKCQRQQKHIKQLREEVRILQTQNKQLKTQIQLYRQNIPTKIEPPHRKLQNQIMPSSDIETKQIERLLKQIRILKNNHQIQQTQTKTQQKKLHKRILQLEDQIHNKQISWQSKCQQSAVEIQDRNKTLEKQIKQLRKAVVQYMEQRDQNQHKIQRLTIQLQEKDKEIQQLQSRGNNLIEERLALQQKMIQLNSQKQQISFKDLSQNFQSRDQNQQNNTSISQRRKRGRDQLYEFGVNSIRRNNKADESRFSVHTFNGARHVPAQQAFQVAQSFRSQIHRLQNEIQRQQIIHKKQLTDLNYMVEKYQKQVKQKDNDIVSLLTKVKPLMLEKNRIISKENVSPIKNMQLTFEQQRQTMGKNAFGLRMLELFLKKYKMEEF